MSNSTSVEAARSKPLPQLPIKKNSITAMTITTTKSSYASTPSRFYISEQESLFGSTRSAQGNGSIRGTGNGSRRVGRGGEGRQRDGVEIYKPENDPSITPHEHLISKNTITYHTNFFEEPEEMEVEAGQRQRGPDPLNENTQVEFGPVGGSAAGALSPIDLESPDSDYYHQPHHQPPYYPAHSQSHRNRSQRSYGQTRTKPVELEYYDVEGSWAWDASGRAYFRGTGKIEEVDEEEEEGAVPLDEDPVLSPRKSSLEALDEENRLAVFSSPEPFDRTDPLPPGTTPPPRPRRVDEAVLSPGGTTFSIPKTAINSGGVSDIGVGRALLSGGYGNGSRRHRVGLDVHIDSVPIEVEMLRRERDTPLPPLPAPLPSSPMHVDEPEEPDLETQMLLGMLDLVKTGVGDIKLIRDYFFRMCAVYFLRKHIDVTYRVEAALLGVQEAIDRRRNMPQSHLDIRTAEWQEKFELRLMSFRTTVQRLTSIRRFVEAHKKLTQQHLEMLLQKLLAHEMKYTDISSKLHASYDRLKLRHLHTQLESAYKAEVEARKERKARKRGSFLRKRIEAKAERAGLRNEFGRERGASTI